MTENRLFSSATISLEGSLLVATPNWENDLYTKSVCLIVHHSSAGAVGVFLNRPVNLDAGQLWKQLLGAGTQAPQASLHFGGPHSGPVVAVHNRAELAEYTSVEGVYFAAQLRHLEELLRLSDQGASMKIIVGQADWEAGQLDQQFAEGKWHPLPVSPKVVFAEDHDMWNQAIREVGNIYVTSISGAHGQPTDILSN